MEEGRGQWKTMCADQQPTPSPGLPDQRVSQDGGKVQGTRPLHELRLQLGCGAFDKSRGYPPYLVALVVAQQQAACHIAMQGAEDWCTQSLNQPVEDKLLLMKTALYGSNKWLVFAILSGVWQFFLAFGKSSG